MIEWLWPGYLALGSLAILDGDPGLGKSMITLDLTARLTTGRAWPDGAMSAGPAPVVLLSDEDDNGVVKARMCAAGVDQACVFPWSHMEDASAPRLPRDIKRLDQALAETKAKLLIIDPIMAFLDSVNVASDSDVRRALRPLARLANERRCAILLVRHLNKREQSHAMYRGGGSIAFVALCRLAWLAGHDPNMADRLLLAQVKNNYAPKQPTLAYSLPKDAPRVDWQGTSDLRADDLTIRRRPGPRRQNAKAFLRTFLSNGPRQAHEVWNAAETHGFSGNTLRAAKEELAIRSRMIPGKGSTTTYWLLPGQELPADVSNSPDLDAIFHQLEQQWPPRSPLDADDTDHGGHGDHAERPA